MTLLWQVLALLFAVGIPAALVRALWPRGTASAAEWARRRAEWLTVALGLMLTYLLVVTVRARSGPDGIDPAGLLPFLALAAMVPVATLVLRGAWRRARSEADAQRPAPRAHLEPVEQPRHRGLSGEDVPPTRW